MTNWANLHKPKSSKELIIGKCYADTVDRFLKQFNDENVMRPSLLITGPNGTGKSMITDLAIVENSFEKAIVNLENIVVNKTGKTKDNNSNKRDVLSWYMTFSASKRMTSDGSYVLKRFVLVFDDANNISRPKDKESIKAIIKLNNKYKKFPIIIISNCKHNKTIGDIRKSLVYTNKIESTKLPNEIKIKRPGDMELRRLITEISKKEKIRLATPVLNCIIHHSHYDTRRVCGILEELKQIYPGEIIDEDKFEVYQDTFDAKLVDLGIFANCETLLSSYNGIGYAQSIFSSDRPSMPLMVHENYLNVIRERHARTPYATKVKTIIEICESISLSDKIDGLIYSKSCWNLQTSYGFHSCVVPSFLTNSLPNRLNRFVSHEYTQDFNKTSTMKNNQKTIRHIKSYPACKKFSTYDFLYISSILKQLLLRKDYQKVAELMGPYKLETMKDLESIIKIDKIKDSRYIIQKSSTTKQKIRSAINNGEDTSKYERIYGLTYDQLHEAAMCDKIKEIKYIPVGKQKKVLTDLLGLIDRDTK